MSQEDIEKITTETLLDKVGALRKKGCRLVQISATRFPKEVELTYSFDLNNRMSHLRLSLPADEPHLPSISSVYGCAVLYENEIHDLFNVKVDGLSLDFGGNFYRTAIKFPFGTVSTPAAKADPAPTPPGAAPAATATAPNQ